MAMDFNTKTNSNATPRPHNDYFIGWILKIAAAMNVELAEATQAVYLERLRQLSAEQMKTAANRTIEEWNKPSMMPPLAFILERCRAYTELMPSKPLPAFRQLRDGSGFSPDEIDEMLQAGKEAQREHQSKIEETPEWQFQAKRFGVPSC
jgi:hypothetical protein